MHRFLKILLVACLIWPLFDAPVFGGGFMVREHSAAALGSGFAGSHSGAHDLADIFFNPAALVYQPDRAALMGMASMMPEAKFRLTSATTVANTATTGTPGGENTAPDCLIPSMYLSQPEWNGWRLGLAVNAPWGLQTKNDPNWVGRYHAIDSKLTSMNIMPTLARRLNSRWVVGMGLQMQKLEARLSNAVDYGTIGAVLPAARGGPIAGAVPTTQDGLAVLNGDDWGFGYVLGFMYEASPRTRLGFSYRSKVAQTLKGTAEFYSDSAGIKNTLAAATGAFVNTAAEAGVTTPEVVGFGVKHDLSASFTVLLDAVWNRWSQHPSLIVTYANPAQAPTRTQEDWRDVWFTSLGCLYKVAPKWTLRAGYAIDNSPIPDDKRTPRIPGSDGRFVSVGARYQASARCHVDVGYVHITYDDAPITLKTTDLDSTFRGNLTGSYKNGFDILATQISWDW